MLTSKELKIIVDSSRCHDFRLMKLHALYFLFQTHLESLKNRKNSKSLLLYSQEKLLNTSGNGKTTNHSLEMKLIEIAIKVL